jgi:uncharacterized protein (TIGR00266 family)
MDHKIIGTTMPVLEVTLSQGEAVRAVSGELSWMNDAITMETSAGGGGFGALLGRAASGASIFLTTYTAQRGVGKVAFAAKLPGQILHVPLHAGQSCTVHRHGFLCGTPGIDVAIAFQQGLGAGIFGGNGFILQRISGQGEAFIELSGEVVTYELAAGESINVHPGHVGMLGANVSFEITRIKGIRNMLFGGDGIFLARLTGPGRVWLQSMTMANLAHALIPYLPGK